MSTSRGARKTRTRSMTGFGRAEIVGADGTGVVVEMSSVNRRQFDFMASLPRELSAYESRLCALVHAEVRRGHVKAVVRVFRAGGGNLPPSLDIGMSRRQLAALRKAGRRLGLPDNLELSDLIALPGVFRETPESGDPEKEWTKVERAARQAVMKMNLMREREGRALACDINARLRRLQKLAERIRRRAPFVMKAYRVALKKRLDGAGLELAADDPQWLREVVLFAERCDISEELTRLASHVDQAQSLLGIEGSGDGRTLDFICQEMLREINTIGAKANDITIARCVIAFKSDLEAAREQVQNIE